MAEEAPTSMVEAPAVAASEGESQVVSGFVWAMLLSCHTHMLRALLLVLAAASVCAEPAHPEVY